MSLDPTIAALRQDYRLAELLETDVHPDPIVQFQRWFDEALAAALPEPNAMTLATVTSEGLPAARIVLLKQVDDRGFSFFTNYNSAKGQEIAAHPHAALVFLWRELERQVRIQGQVEKVSPAESDVYFHSRPPSSRLGAWASAQSSVIADRVILEKQMADLQATYPDGHIPRPEHWGGYRVKPSMIEFWQGRSSRLHDRLRYRKQGSVWIIDRLSP